MKQQAAEFIDHRSTYAYGPIVVNCPARAEQALLKVVAFNARGGGLLEQITERLQRPPLDHPDVILLSELDWGRGRSGRREIAAELARSLTMSFAYVGEFAITRADGSPNGFSGNAILCSRPLTNVTAVAVPNMVWRRRRRLSGAPTGLVARISVNGRLVMVGTVHLHSRWSPAGREMQVRQYMGGVPRDSAAIIGGDFNTTTLDLLSAKGFMRVIIFALLYSRRLRRPQRWETLFRYLQEAGFAVDQANVENQPTFTFTRLIPPCMRPKLDWIALRGLPVLPDSAAVVPAQRSFWHRRFSDHDFVMCVVRA